MTLAEQFAEFAASPLAWLALGLLLGIGAGYLRRKR